MRNRIFPSRHSAGAIGTVFLMFVLVVSLFAFVGWAAFAFCGAIDEATDWRGLIPMAMAAAIPCGLLVAAVGVPISRHRYRRALRRKIAEQRRRFAGKML